MPRTYRTEELIFRATSALPNHLFSLSLINRGHSPASIPGQQQPFKSLVLGGSGSMSIPPLAVQTWRGNPLQDTDTLNSLALQNWLDSIWSGEEGS